MFLFEKNLHRTARCHQLLCFFIEKSVTKLDLCRFTGDESGFDNNCISVPE